MQSEGGQQCAGEEFSKLVGGGEWKDGSGEGRRGRVESRMGVQQQTTEYAP